MDNRVKTPQDLAFDHGGVVGMTYPNQSISQTPEQAAATATFTQAIMAAAAWKRAQASNPQPGMMSANPAPPTTYGTNPASATNSRTVRPGGSGVFMAPTPAQLEARRSAAVAAHEQRYAGQNPAAMTPAQQREYMRSAENARNQQKYRDLANPQAVDFNGQQLPHGSVVGSEGGFLKASVNGMMAVGKNGEEFEFIKDRNTSAVIPTAVGKSIEQFRGGLTDDQVILMDEALTSLEGELGDNFRSLLQRRKALMGAVNLHGQKRSFELDKVENEIWDTRHAMLSNKAAVGVVKSGLDEVRRKKDDASKDTNTAIEAAAQKLFAEQQAKREADVKAKVEELHDPYSTLTPEEERAQAESALGQPPASGAYAPLTQSAGDFGHYQPNPDGTFTMTDENGKTYAAEALRDGSLAVRPRSFSEEESLPDGTRYVVRKSTVEKDGTVRTKDVVQTKQESKARMAKAPPPVEVAQVGIETEAQAIAARRVSAAQQYPAELAKWNLRREENESKTDRDGKIPTDKWLEANPEPRRPKAGLDASPDPTADDIREATRIYYAKHGTTLDRANAHRLADKAREYTRQVVDGRNAILLPDGTSVPSTRVELAGRKESLPSPETAEQAWAVLNNGGPYAAKWPGGGVYAKPGVMDEFSKQAGTSNPRMVADTIDSWFGGLPSGEKIKLARRIMGQ